MMMVEVEQGAPLTSIQISGPTLSSLLQRFSSSSAQSNFKGLLFGHITHSNPPQFTDNININPNPPISTSIATITSFITTNNPLLLFHNENGLIGYFSARKRSPLRPSLNESSLISSHRLNHNNSNSKSVFLLITSPVREGNDDSEVRVHTIEYRAYEYCQFGGSFGLVPKTLEVVNIGPSFRSHYDSFSPTFPFPVDHVSLSGKEVVNCMADQNEGDHEANVVRRLDVLMGPQAKDYTTQLEGLYKGMLDKMDKLAVLVDNTSSMVFQQENRNMKLRFKVAGLE